MEYNRFICKLQTKMHHFSNITMQFTHNWLKTNAWIIFTVCSVTKRITFGGLCVCVCMCACGGIVNVRIIIMNLQKGETMSMYFGDHSYGVGRGIRTISETWEKICNCWFDLATVRRQIWGNDNISCGFGNWRFQLALKWKSGQVKVGFLWGAVIGKFCVNFSPLETQTWHPYRFYCLKWGVTFSQECIISIIQSWIIHNWGYP